MKKLKEMQIMPGSNRGGNSGGGTKQQSASRLFEDQKKMMLALGKDIGNIDGFPGLGLLPGEASLPLNDDSINFSNLESSINPSVYNDSTTNKNHTREKQL